MPNYWAYSIDQRAGLPLPGRPPCEGQRWRPLEGHNPCKRPRDLDAYLRQFTAKPLTPPDPMSRPRAHSHPIHDPQGPRPHARR